MPVASTVAILVAQAAEGEAPATLAAHPKRAEHGDRPVGESVVNDVHARDVLEESAVLVVLGPQQPLLAIGLQGVQIEELSQRDGLDLELTSEVFVVRAAADVANLQRGGGCGQFHQIVEVFHPVIADPEVIFDRHGHFEPAGESLGPEVRVEVKLRLGGDFHLPGIREGRRIGDVPHERSGRLGLACSVLGEHISSGSQQKEGCQRSNQRHGNHDQDGHSFRHRSSLFEGVRQDAAPNIRANYTY